MADIQELTTTLNSALARGDFELARNTCDEILRVDTRHVLALNAMGAISFRADDVRGGIEFLEQALAVDPDSAVTLGNLGEACRMAGETVKAIAYLQRALAIAPASPGVLRSISLAFFRAGRYAEAKSSFERTLGTGSRVPDVCEQYARLLLLQGRYDDCDAFARRVATENCADCAMAADEVAKLSRVFTLIGRKARKLGKKEVAQGAVMVFGVTGRCGTTLIQRLLNSSRRILVFGEDMHLGLHLPQDIQDMATTRIHLGDEVERDRRRLLKGEDFWSPRVYPDLDQYLDLAISGFFTSVRFVARSAKTLKNANRWGIKIPDADAMRIVMALLPDSRYVFIYRNPYDTARSYKSRGWMHDIADYTKLGRDWKRRLTEALPMDAENLLRIKYEDLVESPAAEIDRIRSFVGIEDLNSEVANRKLNAFGDSPTSYLNPSELTEEELAAISGTVSPLAPDLGYHP